MILRLLVDDLLPRRAEVGRLVDERLAVVVQMEVHDDVRGARIEVTGFDLADRAPRRKARDVLRDVGPLAAAVTRVPDLAVVGAGPDETALDLGRRDREHDLAVEL